MTSYISTLYMNYNKHTDIILDQNKVLNQGNEGSCTAHAVCLAASLQCYIENKEWRDFSRRYAMIQAQNYDEYPETAPEKEDGSSIKGCLKGMNKEGLILESTLPYIPGQRIIGFNDSLKMKIIAESSINELLEYRSCMVFGKAHKLLIKQGIMKYGAVVVGCKLPESFFEVNEANYIINDNLNYEGMHANHALAITGWRRIKNKLHWEIINSWGTNWGNAGMCLWEADSFEKACYSAWEFDYFKLD